MMQKMICIYSHNLPKPLLWEYRTQHKNRTAPKPYAARGCTVFSKRSALIEKIADECYLQEEDERYAEDEL